MEARASARVAVLTAAAVGVLALAPGVGGAHGVRYDDRVTIKPDPNFHGRVVSQKAGCEKRRKVWIYREESGPDGLFDSTKTGADGRWELDPPSPQLTGEFYAKIKRKNVGAAGHRHVCKGDRSRSVRVQPPPPP